ncbi:MAG: NAD(P)/FAD-dependent oxidoreductase [Verrucomicrobiae bacterium]|nr:NAD(P)/FAD-dependent oxidoreductase [Verrucomicrobiae bacterium]
MPDHETRQFDLVVIGGGAAGFFGAITAAEAFPGLRVVILEKAPTVLGKVKISGGGRCNVTHACFDPRELVERYPRGGRSLIGPFHHWGPRDTLGWFESRGVSLKTEADGRMFPVTDDSQTIIDCLSQAAEEAGVKTWTRCEVVAAAPNPQNETWRIELADAPAIETRSLLLATGGIRSGIGARIAADAGHRIEPAAPSLFTFKISGDPRLTDLAGVSVGDAIVSVPGTKLRERGPVLITHWGLSGPGILKLSAWGARELQARDYRFEAVVNWTGLGSVETIADQLRDHREKNPRATVAGRPAFGIPSRLWQRLAAFAKIRDDQRWAQLTREEHLRLAETLGGSVFAVTGKSTHRDEFVTCGGVALKEVDFRTMESRLAPGLYFAGEVLDIDGVTGGFNFQAAWTTGRIAGEAIAGFAG